MKMSLDLMVFILEIKKIKNRVCIINLDEYADFGTLSIVFICKKE